MAAADVGTSVTLVVPAKPQTPGTPQQPVPPTQPGPSHVPFTGFELTTALTLAAVLLAVGLALVALATRTRKA